MEVRGQHHDQTALRPGKNPGIQRIGVWVGPGAGMDVSEKIKMKIEVFRATASYRLLISYQVLEQTAASVLSNKKNTQGCKSSRSIQQGAPRSAEYRLSKKGRKATAGGKINHFFVLYLCRTNAK